MRITRAGYALASVMILMEPGLCLAQRHEIRPENLAPFIPSPEPVVEQMLKLADLKPGETLYDLGCGDGRILFLAAQQFQAKAVGIELSSKLAREASIRAKELGLEDRVKVIEGNLLKTDISSADVVTLYLLRLSNEKLKPNLLKQLKAGARVVSHDFEIMGWKPQAVWKVTVHRRAHLIYLYKMPPIEE
jgi:SAM-dependent methyltransferase